jgi:hypothetical protein
MYQSAHYHKFIHQLDITADMALGWAQCKADLVYWWLIYCEIHTDHTDDFTQEWEDSTVRDENTENFIANQTRKKSYWHSWLTCNRAPLQQKQLLRSFMKYLFERSAPVLNTSHSIDTFLSSTATMLETFVFYYFRSEKSSYCPRKE